MYGRIERKPIFIRSRWRRLLVPRGKVTGARLRRRRPGRYNPTYYAFWAITGVGGLAIIVVLFILLLRSPLIREFFPGEGSVVRGNPLPVMVCLRKGADPARFAIRVDGEEVDTAVDTERNALTADLRLPDGEHVLELWEGEKRLKSVRFILDNQPPELVVEGREVREDGISLVQGRLKGAKTAWLREKPLRLDKDGFFQVEIDRERELSVAVKAVDEAGNEAEYWIDALPPPKVKGIHLSIWTASSMERIKGVLNLVDKTELNAVQLDIKDETGSVGYPTGVSLAREVGSYREGEGMEVEKVLDKCWYHGVYTIGRVVCFKDPILARKRPDLAVRTPQGGLWGGGLWLDPYNREVWDYILDLCIEAVKKGFREIQLDYVRFPSDGDVSTCVYPSRDGRSQAEVITDFVRYIRDGVKPYGVVLSADVFGLIASEHGEMGIGQDLARIAGYVDYLCPMVYPSHYGPWEYGLKNPEASPYQTVLESLKDFKKKLEGTGCRLRPWLQDFTMKVHYGAEQVRAQIKACYDLGIEEWLLWNPNSEYTTSALAPE
ncbi:MAG: putative glycoside hydrolase [Candidatus Geothermincolales bacterium]